MPVNKVRFPVSDSIHAYISGDTTKCGRNVWQGTFAGRKVSKVIDSKKPLSCYTCMVRLSQDVQEILKREPKKLVDTYDWLESDGKASAQAESA